MDRVFTPIPGCLEFSQNLDCTNKKVDDFILIIITQIRKIFNTNQSLSAAAQLVLDKVSATNLIPNPSLWKGERRHPSPLWGEVR
jgi:hypothetical protein